MVYGKIFQKILKEGEKFRSEKYVFIEEINKIPLSSIDHKRMQSIDSIETYAHGINKSLQCKNKKLNAII